MLAVLVPTPEPPAPELLTDVLVVALVEEAPVVAAVVAIDELEPDPVEPLVLVLLVVGPEDPDGVSIPQASMELQPRTIAKVR